VPNAISPPPIHSHMIIGCTATPMTAGSEEMDFDDKFPLIDQFKQTNMKPGGRKPRQSQSQMGIDND